MGNVFSRCCPKNPCERQDEDQRLLHESVPSPQTSSKALEECPVSTDCTTPESSSETPSPAEEKVADQLKAGLSLDTSAPELIPGQTAAQVQTDVLATQVKPTVANDVHMQAASPVDNSTLVDQQEAAAGVVSQVLEDASKIVGSSGEGGVITSFASQPLVVPRGGDGPLDAPHEKVESQAESMEKPEEASTMTNSSQAADVGVESQSASTPIKSPTTPTSKVESLPTPTVSDGQAEGECGCSSIRSQAVPSEKLESQDSVPTEENHAAAAAAVVVVESGGQAVTEDLETHISARVIDSQATSSITNSQSVSAKIVPEIPGCSGDTEDFAKITETSPLKTTEKKEVFSELQQVPAGHLNGSLVEAVLVRETAEEVIHSTTKSDGTKVNQLTQNSSAEENELNASLSETPKGSPPSPETCVQFGLLTQQGDSSAARGDEPGGEGEGEGEATSTVPDMEDMLTEDVPPHSSDDGHGVSMEGSFSESDLDLPSAPTDTSVSMQDRKEIKRTEGEPCNGEDISSTSGKEADSEGRLAASASDQQMAPKDGRDSAADTEAQDVAGLTAVSSLQDLLDEEEVETTELEGEDAETKSAVSGVEDGGHATSPVDERPGSAGRSSSVESDGNELNCEEDLYRGEEEIEEEQELNKLEITGLEGRCSLEPPVAILTYSEREWRGQTTKSAVIRKGYTMLSQSFASLRRVRGDNYCALRATLYQALMNTTQPPDWLQQESFLLIPEELEARYGVIKDWRFPDICKQMNGIENAVDLLKHYLGLLQKWWQEAASSPGPEGHTRVCEELFQGGVDEFGLLEALKLLMLARAVELHAAMQSGHDVPIFCFLLFARDTSSCPRTLVANHLSHMGFSGGLEQVEMFLLGYALRHTIKAYRLYMSDTEEFITHYPDDHTQDWPCLCLVTEDDRHYNVVGGDPAHPQKGPPPGLQ